jgi:chorismate mutase
MLKILRDQIDTINAELVALLGKRIHIAREIARIKKEQHLPILDSDREGEIKSQMKKRAIEHGISPHVTEEIFQLILDYSRIEMGSL